MVEFNKIYNVDCLTGMNEIDFLNNKFIIITYPPFNIGYKYETYKDKMEDDDYYSWLISIFKNLPLVIIHYPENLYKLAIKMNKSPLKVISWVYNAHTKKQHRDIAFFDIKPDLSKVKQPYKNPTDKRVAEKIKNGSLGADIYDWWFINQVKNVSKEKTEHPCQMPLEVMNNIIKLLPEDYIIIDPFCGSGTTIEACILNNRKYIGFEIDEKYYKIILKRISQLSLEL